MPWKESSPMDQKTQFIADYIREVYSFTELCERYGISRKTGYKWADRYLKEGPPGLSDKSRAPKSMPTRTPQKVIDALLELRTKHPNWGAKKLLVKLSERKPNWDLPHPSTVYDLLKPYGVIPKRRRKSVPGHAGYSQIKAYQPNDIWCTDFKGQFKLGNGNYCYPLTITDQNSRFILNIKSLPSVETGGVKPIFTRVFKEYGLPKFIRSDNGVPFATSAIRRLSALSAWWIQLGIIPDLIEPGKPQQNGRHERMHRTLKDETTRPAAYSSPAQQRKFNSFVQEFNFDRPHEALDMKTPGSIYEPSLREMPSKIKYFEYPDRYEVRYISANGCFRWNNRSVNLSHICHGQYIGLEEIDFKIWNVYYGPVKLGIFHEHKLRIEDHLGRLNRNNPKNK